MRLLLLPLLLAFAAPSFAEAAQSNWFDDLLGAKPVHATHRPTHRAAPKQPDSVVPKPDATPAPPIPLPRPRPELQQAAPSPAGETAVKPASGDTDKPAADFPSPANASGANGASAPAVGDESPGAPAPKSTPPSTPATEGESATPKPPRVYQTACPAVITGLVDAKPLPPISEGACQEQSPLSVTAILVNGRMVPLSAPSTFNCGMATDLPGWVADVDNYIAATQETRIKAVLVGESFICRPRNTPDGSSDLSEHGRADALDFVGFALEDGRQLTVTADYTSADATLSRLMHFAHDAACTRFTTVLGPDANALHHDHFHLDLGCHGKTCTYRLCE